jgi:hypothetical protein
VAATGSVPARGRRHPITAVTEARRLANGGWNDVEISELLLRNGFVREPVSKVTVGRWVRAQRAQRWREDIERTSAARAAEAGARALGRRDVRPEFKLARMRALREHVGLKDAQIARLMRHDFGDEITRDMVAHALATGRYPRSLR